jgi:hypothetical protein
MGVLIFGQLVFGVLGTVDDLVVGTFVALVASNVFLRHIQQR